VSDQDFFSEGEETELKEEKATKASDRGGKTTPAKSTTARAATNKPAARPAAKPAPKGAASKAPEPQPSFFDQTVTMAMASLLAIVGLLLGVIIGYFVFNGGGTPTVSTAPGSVQSPSVTGTGTAAPPLSQDQINAGQLPAGHPKLPGSTTTTPTK
jgi:hypothetical protein